MKKEIIIKAENIEKIETAILEAEGRATCRCLSVEQVKSTVSEVETHLGITKKALEGVEIMADPNAQTFPNAYRYTPQSTYFKAVYRHGTWRLTAVYRARTAWPGRAVEIKLTEAAKAAIIENAGYMKA